MATAPGVIVERAAGIEPALRAWKAPVIPFHHARTADGEVHSQADQVKREPRANLGTRAHNRKVAGVNPAPQSVQPPSPRALGRIKCSRGTETQLLTVGCLAARKRTNLSC